MLSNARGKHSSPGVYMEEHDVSYATKSLGITTLGLVGETLKGPAFEPIHITDWTEFQEYFGGTSTEKYKGNGYPKYELPYIAKSYLQESNQLEVCRVLGFSGYNAGPSWGLYALNSKTNTKYIIGILRSKGEYTNSAAEGTDKCNPDANYDKLNFAVSKIEMGNYTSLNGILNGYSSDINKIEEDLLVTPNNYGRFTLIITTNKGEEKVAVSLNPGEKEYIIDVLGIRPDDGNYSVFVEELYDLAHIKGCEEGEFDAINVIKLENIDNYKSQFTYASTPWFVSELKGNGTKVDMKKLFRFHTISDGNAANSQIKISIANILPDEGLFDVIIRDFNDTDNSPLILERYSKCNMIPGTSNYIGLKIGTFNGDYSNKSKYVTVEVIENEMTETCVPCGFLGYPMRKYDGFESINLAYNTKVYETLKTNRQYFGMSDITGVDLDVLYFKGNNAYTTASLPTEGYSNGFHLDSLLNVKDADGNNLVEFTVDGISGYKFNTVSEDEGKGDFESFPRISSEDVMKDNIYSDKRLRKFTCYPCGGFDGWDIYRTERTNQNDFKANKYKGNVGEGNTFTSAFDSGSYGLTGKVISSDYYAYLAGYKQFDNPSKIKINILATPGIDYVNNLDLVNEVLDIVEDSRQGDCIYIVTTPDTEKWGAEIDADSAVSNLESSELNTSYAATYYPWVKYYDAANKKYINLPATKDVVRNFAYTDNVAHPWFASAGMTRGSVDCVKATHFTKLEEEDVLYEGMINPIKSFGSDGVKIWGNKTIYSQDTPLNRINVRRLMIRVKDLVMNASRNLIFEQNDNTVESQFLSLVNPILANAKQNRGISDYKIKTDTSAEARDRKELPAKIWIKPINCLEYISLSFVVTPEGASFED